MTNKHKKCWSCCTELTILKMIKLLGLLFLQLNKPARKSHLMENDGALRREQQKNTFHAHAKAQPPSQTDHSSIFNRVKAHRSEQIVVDLKREFKL